MSASVASVERTRHPPDLDPVSPPAPGRTTVWGRATLWLIAYLAVVVAWGQRNSWPDELLLCILQLPLTALVIAGLYAIHRFGLETAPVPNQQEQLIAALVLAVGLASGHLILMSLGLTALAVAWLRPDRPGLEWAEWLKVPLLLLPALPFWLDLLGSRSPAALLFDNPLRNPPIALPLAVVTSQARVLGCAGLLAAALLLPGRVFWLAIAGLPAALTVLALAPAWVPRWASLPAEGRHALPWVLGALVLAALMRFAPGIEAAARRLRPGNAFHRWFEDRLYPPWLAVLVVVATLLLPLQSVSLDAGYAVACGGMVVMAGILLGLRRRTPAGPIHSRSVSAVAGGLALILLAEFTTSPALRQLAFGMVVIGLISWHRFWPLRIFALAAAAAAALLLEPADVSPALALGTRLLVLRTAVAVLLLLALGYAARHPGGLPGQRGYDEEAWVPARRFSLILLGLMVLFQTASAFWPDHDIDPVATAPDHRQDLGMGWMQTSGQTACFRWVDRDGTVLGATARLTRNPYSLESPERTLRQCGWKVLRRQRVPHPQGEAMALLIEREGVTATTLWWFQQGQRAFTSHLYARRVLWSGWHLSDRDLRLIRLESFDLHEPGELADFAARHGWLSSLSGEPGATP